MATAIPRVPVGEDFFGVPPPPPTTNYDFSIAPAGGTLDLPATAYPVDPSAIWTPPLSPGDPGPTAAIDPYAPPSPYTNDFTPQGNPPLVDANANTDAALPPAPTPTTTNAPQAPTVWDYNTFTSQFGSPSTPQQLIALEPRLNAAGIQVLRNAEGVAGKIKLPDGRVIDVIQNAGSGGTAFQWGDWGGSGGGSGSSGGFGGGSLSDMINAALMGSLQGGSTPYGDQIAQMLLNIIQGGGQTPDLSQQLIGARTDMARAQQSMLADTDAALAARGIASTPGVAQGGSIGGVERTMERVAPEFAGALRDIETHGMDLANANVMQSLALATGLSEDQAHNLLSAIGAGTQRQTALSGIALQQLSLSQDWNKFLLSYGLDQQKLAEDIANGRMDRVIALLQIFTQGGASASNGYI